MPTFLHPYRKTVIAVVGALIAFATLVVTSDPTAITSSEWLSLGVSLATALGVYGVANGPTDEGGQVNATSIIIAAAVAVLIYIVLEFVIFDNEAGGAVLGLL